MTCSTACRTRPSKPFGVSPHELALRESLIFLDGPGFTGDPPRPPTIQRGPRMLVYLTDVRDERVVIIQVNWLG